MLSGTEVTVTSALGNCLRNIIMPTVAQRGVATNGASVRYSTSSRNCFVTVVVRVRSVGR